MKRLLGLVAAMLIAMGPATLRAQDFPNRPIRLVVPFPPGGGLDTTARIVAPRVGEILGSAVVVENRPGAAGTIGVDSVAKSAPDGYTIVIGSPGNMSLAPSLNPKLPYKPLADLEPLSMGVQISNVLVVHPSVPANNVTELIALARANPGKYTYASGGSGTALHLAGELFKLQAKVELLHVPYKGTSLAINDLLAGHVHAMFSDPAAMPFVASGRLRALAQTTSKRSSSMPDLPTLAESGLTGYDATNWYGFFAPAGTPGPVVSKLNAALVQALRAPEIASKLTAAGMDAAPSSSNELRAFLKEDIERWAHVIKEAKIEPN